MIGRALVVDGIRLNGILLRRAPAEIGIESVEARSGLEAIELLAREKFEVIMRDLLVPALGGSAPSSFKDLRSRAGGLRRVVDEGEP